MAINTFDPKLSQYRMTQLVDLCKAREVGNTATPTSASASASSDGMCSTFQSLIHGNSDRQVADANIPLGPFGRK